MTFKNLDKIFWPEDKLTKGDLLQYYETISPFILPYLKNRPLAMHRFPDGIHGQSFYQKEAGQYNPKFVKTFPIQHEEKKISYILVQDIKTLLYVANLGAELHPFNSNIKHVLKPDYMVLDLDPEDISFDAVVDTALVIHDLLDELKVPHYCKTSGATGLHIYIPTNGKYDYEQVKQCAQLLATLAHQKIPDFTSLERSPKKRQKCVYIDFLQNREMQSMIGVHSVRFKPHATVSTPLEWKEVKHGLDPVVFTIQTIPDRLKKKGDLFSEVLGKGINLETVLKKVEKVI